MKQLTVLILLAVTIFSCGKEKEVSSINTVDWEKRTVKTALKDTLATGATYLSVYSQIYSLTEHQTHDLTATISMRNTNRKDTIYLHKAEYFNTHGVSIRTYFNTTIFLAPMETVEIIIDETDREGGTGANFIFDWSVKPTTNEPLFEGVMISTSGQQGLSFTTAGIKINK